MTIYEAILNHLKEDFATQFSEHELVITQGNNFRTLKEGQVLCNVNFSSGANEGGGASQGFSTMRLNAIITFKYLNNEQREIVSRISSATKIWFTNRIRQEVINVDYDDDGADILNFIYNLGTPTTNGNVTTEQSFEGKSIKTSTCLVTGEIVVTSLPVNNANKRIRVGNNTYWCYSQTGYSRNKTWNYSEMEVDSPYNQSEFESYNEVIVITFFKLDTVNSFNKLSELDIRGLIVTFNDGTKDFSCQILSYAENEVNGITNCTLTLKVVA